jgi:hypothetical protein
MKRLLNYIIAITLGVSFTQCNDYLNTSSPSNIDDVFVTSTAPETFKSLSWCYSNYRYNAAMGVYNWNDPVSSDAEYYPENGSSNNINAKLKPELLAIDAVALGFNNLYITLARASRIAAVIAQKSEYKADIAAGKTSDWTQLYGEAVAINAFCYFNLTKHFGDVPYGFENAYVDAYNIKSRFDIYDDLIAKLKAVEPYMYKIGEGGITAERISKTFVDAMIGQIAFYSGGYQTIRTDIPDLYGSVQFTVKGSVDNTYNCEYARRNDYLEYYKIAEEFLQKAYNVNNGTAQLITTDSRGGTINNPFQMHFQNMANFVVSPESLFELGNIQSTQVTSEFGYAFSRPSDGGSANNAPCKAFAALRIVPTVYYGEYDNADKRRDPSVAVTGSSGKGNEAILNFAPGSRLSGGIATNKWDENRMKTPFTTAQRASGYNWPVLRMADVMLMLAWTKAELGGKDADAIALVNLIRQRAFGDTNHGISGLTGQALVNAVLQERKLELLGEATRRWDLILSGTLPERAMSVKAEMNTMIADLKAQGYHTFANGNVISNYVYTKLVNQASPLTYDCTNTSDPVLFPGWRGQYNWSSISAVASIIVGTNHNLAIQGLFSYIDPTSATATTLVSSGYTKSNWAIDIANNATVYNDNILGGITATDQVPRYYWPIPAETITKSNGTITNGYGLAQK